MRVLVVSIESPTPVVNGASLRLFHLLDELRERHDIHVVCYGRSVDLEGVTSTVLEPPALASLATRLRRGLRSLASSPALAQETRSGGLDVAAAELGVGGHFDVAHLSGAATAVVAGSLSGLPILWDTIDAWHLSRAEEARADPFPRSVLRRAGSLSIRRFEHNALQSVGVTTTTSHADRAALLDVSPSARVEVVPNGVDTSYFAPQAARSGHLALIAFHGNFGYSPNADAARFLALDVLPRVAKEVPDTSLRLIGRNPPDNVQALARPGIEVTGEVADVRPLLADAAVVACAVRTGTGIKNKLLEAAALGLPIVATTGAVGDLDLHDGEQVLIRDGAESIARAIVELLGNPSLREHLGTAARAAVTDRWSWPRSADSFEALYGAIIRA